VARGLRPVGTGLALALWAALAWRYDFVCDDAYISFRYARHLAEGLGLAYNPGLEPPVEGYTNFLWVLWCALFELAGVDVTVGARLSSAACAAATLLFVVHAASRAMRLEEGLAPLPALVLASLPPFAVWSTSGLDTMPYTLALFATWERLLGDPERPRTRQAALAGVATALLRADGAVFVALVAGLALLRARARRSRVLARAALAVGAVSAAAVLAQLAFRLAYYGDFVPNTAHAKVSFSPFALTQGRNYVVTMLLTFPAIALVPLLAALWMALRRRAAGPVPELLVLVVAIPLYVAIVAGGDFMPMARLLVPALPFVALLAAVPLQGVVPPARHAARAAAALAWTALLIAISLPPAFDRHVVPGSLRHAFRFRVPITMSEHEFWRLERDRTLELARMGRRLAEVTQPGETLVGEAIGALGYYSRLGIFDSFGLVTREVARREVSDAELLDPYRPPGHHKGVPPEFFLPREPDYLAARIVFERRSVADVPGYRAEYHLLPGARSGRAEFLYLLAREKG
jgi:arabinofuranosyltransferase